MKFLRHLLGITNYIGKGINPFAINWMCRTLFWTTVSTKVATTFRRDGHEQDIFFLLFLYSEQPKARYLPTTII
jgi:hypothetical protein